MASKKSVSSVGMDKSRKGACATIDCYIKLPSGRTISMDMVHGDAVSKIYEKVAQEQSVPVDRVLIKYTGKVLKPDVTVGYLGVCAETVLKAEIIEIKRYNLFVKLEEGRTISLEVENVSPVSFIKNLIEKAEGIPPRQQKLKFRDTVLATPSQRVLEAGITDEGVLTLQVTKDVKPTGSMTSEEESARENDSAAAAEVSEADKQTVLSTFDAAGRRVEVVFSFDTTGSMYSCLSQVRSKLRETIERLTQHIPTIRIGIIAHGDYCDYSKYVLRMVDLTSNVNQLVSFVGDVPSTGGGDAPECYEWVLHKAVNMDWSENSAKALVMIGDCTPHGVNYTDQHINWHDELDLLKGMGVKVYGVKALTNSESLPFYQELADRTGGAFISFTNFSIITEMFLAVCYREASDEQFDAFCEEVAQSEGQDHDDTQGASSKVKDIQNVLAQLDEQKNKTAEDEPKRYVATDWWDPALDLGSPRYSYNTETDTWQPFRSEASSRKTPTRSASFHITPAAAEKKNTKPKRSFSLRTRSRHTHSSQPMTVKSQHTKKKGCAIM